jgi:hypothetical protein
MEPNKASSGFRLIGPFSQQAGITEPPETIYRDVHNHLPHS